MQFITTKAPTTLTALTQQVFDTHGLKPADAEQAQAALRAANPHWGDQAELPAGTFVIVPKVPGIQAAASQPAEAVSAAVVGQLKQVLVAAQAVLELSIASEKREIETSLSLAKSRDLVGLAIETPELRDLLAQVNEQAKLQLEQIAANQAESLQGLAQLEKELGSLNP